MKLDADTQGELLVKVRGSILEDLQGIQSLLEEPLPYTMLIAALDVVAKLKVLKNILEDICTEEDLKYLDGL